MRLRPAVPSHGQRLTANVSSFFHKGESWLGWWNLCPMMKHTVTLHLCSMLLMITHSSGKQQFSSYCLTYRVMDSRTKDKGIGIYEAMAIISLSSSTHSP